MNDKMTLSDRIKALEKATAKKPYNKEKYPDSYYCPRCNNNVSNNTFLYRPHYCENCGQKLGWNLVDWGDTNE